MVMIAALLLLAPMAGALWSCGSDRPQASGPDTVLMPDKADLVDDASVGDGSAGPPIQACPLPESLQLRGSPSSIRVVDLDRDGYHDVILLVARHDDEVAPGTLAVVVAWGDETVPFAQRTVANLPGTMPLTPAGRGSTRDASSEALVIGDLDRDGVAEIVTAQGWLTYAGDRDLAWHPFSGSDTQHLQPVALIDFSGEGNASPAAIRGTTAGEVERCGVDGSCVALPGQDQTCLLYTSPSPRDLGSNLVIRLML